LFVLVCVVGLVGAVRPAVAGTTERVSVASDGTQGNEVSGELSSSSFVSADGRFVAFHAQASNLVPGDTNGWLDVFVHDRETEETTRISVVSDGTEGNGYSYTPCISGDGRFVAFHSYATALVPGDTNKHYDIFVHDRQTGQTTRVSVTSDGAQGNGFSTKPSTSPDGRFVAFNSNGSNLVPGDTNDNTTDVFVHDRGVTVTVKSAPISGLSITGSKPGTTDYTAFCDDQEVVNLTAPGSATAGNVEYDFVRWIVDGAEGPLNQADVQITMDADHTAEARYVLVGDVNGDCIVNILDMIGVRNHLYEDVGSGDNWRYDLTGDGMINVLDMMVVRNNARNRCP